MTFESFFDLWCQAVRKRSQINANHYPITTFPLVLALSKMGVSIYSASNICKILPMSALELMFEDPAWLIKAGQTQF